MKKIIQSIIAQAVSNTGSGLLTAIIVLAIGTLVMMGVQKQTSTAYKMTTYDEQLQAIEGIKRTIRDNLHCGKTLGIPMSKEPPPKNSCAGYAGLMDIKDSGGNVLNFSSFEIKTGCENDFLKVKIVAGPKIGGRKTQDWSDTAVAKDLFNGTEEFCRAYFDNAYPYTWLTAGNLMVNNLWEGTSKYCRHKNSATGDCTCPEGFARRPTYDFYNNGCGAGSGRPSYYGDSGDKVPKCSVQQFICVAWN